MPLQGLLSDRMFVGRGSKVGLHTSLFRREPLDPGLAPPPWGWRRSITGSVSRVTGSVSGAITGSIAAGPIAGRSITGWAAEVAVVPVTAAVPVLVRAPALVPLVARAPVMVVHRCRRRRRVGSARCQAERGKGHATSGQGASAQTKPRFLRIGIHAPKNSRWPCTQTSLVGSRNHKSCSQLGYICD
jgi:hypothetical protein